MKYVHLEEKTNKILGWYDDKIHSEIPTPNVEVSDKTWQVAININANFYDKDTKTFILKDLRTLEEMKKSKLTTINIACETAIISGFKSSSLQAEYLYQSDRDDQLNLMGLVANGIDNFLKCGLATIVLENSIEKEVITWDYILHTIAQLKQVLADGAKYKLDLLTKANTLKIQVQNATTVNELDGINW